MIILDAQGDFLHISENVKQYLDLTCEEILIANDGIYDIVNVSDRQRVRELFSVNSGEPVKGFITQWNVHKRKSKKSTNIVS